MLRGGRRCGYHLAAHQAAQSSSWIQVLHSGVRRRGQRTSGNVRHTAVCPAGLLPRKIIQHSGVFPRYVWVVLAHSNGHLTPQKPVRNVGFNTPGWKKQAHNLRLTFPPLFFFYKPIQISRLCDNNHIQVRTR